MEPRGVAARVREVVVEKSRRERTSQFLPIRFPRTVVKTPPHLQTLTPSMRLFDKARSLVLLMVSSSADFSSCRYTTREAAPCNAHILDIDFGLSPTPSESICRHEMNDKHMVGVYSLLVRQPLQQHVQVYPTTTIQNKTSSSDLSPKKDQYPSLPYQYQPKDACPAHNLL